MEGWVYVPARGEWEFRRGRTPLARLFQKDWIFHVQLLPHKTTPLEPNPDRHDLMRAVIKHLAR